MTNPHRRISAAVKAAGIHSPQLAEVLDLHPVAVRDRMRGRTLWSLAEAIAVADLLGVSLDDLVRPGEDIPCGYVPTGAAAR